MSDPILTPPFRAGFVALFKPSKPKTAAATQEPKFSVQAFFPPNTDFSAMKKSMEEAWNDFVVKEWPKPEDRPKIFKKPFRKHVDNDGDVEPKNWPEEVPVDWIMVNFSQKQDRRPPVVDQKVQDIIDEQEIYSGVWLRAQVRAFGYHNSGNKGVSFGLNMVQKTKDDKPFKRGGGPGKPSDVFSAVEGGTNAGDLFD